MFVTVEEVASAHMKELEAIYPVLNAEKAKDADESFKSFIQNVFDKKGDLFWFILQERDLKITGIRLP